MVTATATAARQGNVPLKCKPVHKNSLFRSLLQPQLAEITALAQAGALCAW
jgi:hypothetical protein